MKADLTSLMGIGNIQSHVKNLKLQTQFKERKRTGDFSSHQSSTGNWMLDKVKEQQENDKIGRIGQKILAGKKLTKEEEDYLREKNPQGYQDYLNNLKEQEAYREQIRRCKTKDEVQQLKIDKVNAALTTVKAAESALGKGASNIAMAELAKLQAFDRLVTEFIESCEYDKLPTEAELAEARKAEKEAEEAARAESAEDPATAETDEDKGTAEEETATGIEKPDGSQEPHVEAQEKPKAAAEGHTAGQRKPKAHAETSAGSAKGVKQGTVKPAVVQGRPAPAPETAEQRKVRRAKAKAAYTAVSTLDTSTIEDPRLLDVRG